MTVMSEPEPSADETVTAKDGDELDLEELEKVTGGARATPTTTAATELKPDPKFGKAIKLGMK